MEPVLDMISVIDDQDNLRVPFGFKERALIVNRLRFEHPKVSMYQSFVDLFSEHRYMLGLRYISQEKRTDKQRTRRKINTHDKCHIAHNT